MDKQGTVAWLTILLCILLLLSSPVAAMESNSYAIKWDVMAGGNGPIQSASYAINSTIGQSVIGPKTSSSYQLGSGYWYGVARQNAIYLPVVLRSHVTP
jgi:hypothetical protein